MAFKLLKKMNEGDFEFDTSMSQQQVPYDPEANPDSDPATAVFRDQPQDHPDVVAMDVPTLIRIMEWSHEDAKDDVMLHEFANALIVCSFKHSPLDMDDYIEVCKQVCPESLDDESTVGSGNSPEDQAAMNTPSGVVDIQSN
jgi:hypothetical protein